MATLFADQNEDVERPVLAIGDTYPASFELAEHWHRRSQFLYAKSGVMAVSTPEGAWVAPSERAVWIPGGMPHSVRMVGAVQTRSVLIEADACPNRGKSCQVVISALADQAGQLGGGAVIGMGQPLHIAVQGLASDRSRSKG